MKQLHVVKKRGFLIEIMVFLYVVIGNRVYVFLVMLKDIQIKQDYRNKTTGTRLFNTAIIYN